MSGHADYRIAILPYPPGQGAGYLPAVDITDDCTLQDFGSINRAVEGDFLSFRTGDLTLAAINDDGKFDDLFGNLGPTDRWQLHVFRRGKIIFLGIILGQGSITFHRKERMVEITAYGATKLLDDTSAENVTRAIAPMTVTTATAGQAQITLNSTAGLLTGDVLHLTDQINKEDVTVKQVTSATGATLESALSNSYAAGLPVVLSTQGYRYKTPDFLVRALFAAAGVPLQELKIGGSLFRRLAPTPLNLAGLDLTKQIYYPAAQSGGAAFVTQGGGSTLSQATPDAAWVASDAVDRPWLDLSKAYLQTDPEPAVICRAPGTGSAAVDAAHKCGVDYRSATKRAWFLDTPAGVASLRKRTTADGTTWAAAVTEAALPDNGAITSFGCEYDQGRDGVYVAVLNSTVDTKRLLYRDLGGGTWTTLIATASGLTPATPTYVPELDMTIVAAFYSSVSPHAVRLLAYRGTALLWDRTLALNTIDGTGTTFSAVQSIRYVNGSLYAVLMNDGGLTLLRTEDQFQTYSAAKIGDASTPVQFGSRINGSYYVAGYSAGVFRSYQIAAPFYAGVILYADFGGKTVAEALQAIAVLVNATFWVDDDFQGHFVARDQLPAGDVPDLTERDLILEQGEIQLWDQARQYVEVTGAGITATAGDPNFASDKISVNSDFLPNQAYAQALADQYAEFYAKRRPMLPVSVLDDEDLELFPMRRVMVDGRRLYVHESDHEPMNDEWVLKLLEDLEGQAA